MANSHIFYVKSDIDSGQPRKLLSYTGVAKGGKMVLTLKVEIEGYDIPYVLENLEAIRRAHSGPSPKQRDALARHLGFPAPDQEGL